MPKAQEPQPKASGEHEDGFTVVETSRDDGKDIHILVDDDHLKAFVKITLKNPAAVLDATSIADFLKGHSIKVSDTAVAALAKATGAKNRKLTIGPLLMGQGRAAVNGNDGSIEWLVARPDLDKQATADRVNYRDRRAIVNVKKDQRILKILPPTAGQAGEDVFGSIIPSQAGRPVSMRKGKNVEITAEGTEFYALVPGMVEAVGDAVSVEPELEIQGDVDMTVGNISFIGPVRIAKDVRDDFQVRAGKEIEIGGMVECADIVSGSWIKIQGGVAGKGRGRIVCKAGLEARYLSEVRVEAGGDVVVNNSITTASVKSLGRVVVNNGGIRGSSVVAQKGLKSPEIGSDMGVRTTVIVGVDYHMKDKLVNMERELQAIREAVEKIEQALGPLVANGAIISTLPPEKAEIARRLVGQLDMLVQKGNAVTAAREQLIAQMQVGADTYIEVTKKIYPGVIMQIGTCRRTFELEVTGPMKLLPDVENASIKVSR
jgi:uncharacterized protein